MFNQSEKQINLKYKQNLSNKLRNFSAMKSLLALTNDAFWRGFFGPFFAFGFPIIFIAILGSMIGYDLIFAGSIAISTMAISLTSMPQAIFEFKNSSLLKRIGSTPIKPYLFLLVTGFYYFFIMIISLTWSILFCMILFGSQYWDLGKIIGTYSDDLGLLSFNVRYLSFSKVLSSINWGNLIWGQLMAMLVGTSCAMMLVSISKSTLVIQTVGITIMITSLFLSGQVLPMSMAREETFIWYLGYFISPFKASTSIFLESVNGDPFFTKLGNQEILYNFVLNSKEAYWTPNITTSNIFDLTKPYYAIDKSGNNLLEIFSSWEKLLNIFIPFIWAFVFSLITTWKFRWSIKD